MRSWIRWVSLAGVALCAAPSACSTPFPCAELGGELDYDGTCYYPAADAGGTSSGEPPVDSGPPVEDATSPEDAASPDGGLTDAGGPDASTEPSDAGDADASTEPTDAGDPTDAGTLLDASP